MIEFIDIRKRFARIEILRGFSAKIETGQLVLLLGPNGAGKTTLLKIAAGVLSEESGQVRCGDGALTLAERRREFAYLPQGVAFQPRLSARQLLRFYARALGADRNEIEPALERWGLTPHAAKRSADLSGGLRQRLGLAILSLARTRALLLDEPGISLDAEWRERMQVWLRDEAREGKSVLVATHLLGEWEGRADRSLLCREGRMVEEIDPSRLHQDALEKVRQEERKGAE